MFRNALLAATCFTVIAGGASAETMYGPVQLAANADAKSTVAKPSTAKPAAMHQMEYMMRASEFIGEDVHNGKGEEVGSVDDLILHRDDKVLYAVISVGGFLGIGDKLVAVPFDELKLGVKEVDGLIVYDTTKDKLKALPEFHYAVAKDSVSRERFMRSAEQQIDRWQARIDENTDHAKDSAKEMKKDASDRIDSAWKKVKAEWKELKGASAEAWDDAKRKFDDAMADLERAWDDATT
jgi:sporulation protein YlmC with PRC-barrel domain